MSRYLSASATARMGKLWFPYTIPALMISRFIVGIVKEPVGNALALLQRETRLSAIAHGVDVRDIANEIYHLIFGETNEILVRSGLVSTPPYYPGEGRYFRSFEQ